MTIDIQLPEIVESIAGIRIAGMRVVNMDQVPENAIDYCPILYPTPDQFVTEPVFERISFGADNQAKMDLSYTLRYRYLHAPIGSGATLETYIGLLTNLALILEAILGNSSPTGAINMQLQGLSDLGPVTDVGGQTVYHGIDIMLRVLEFAQ